MAAALGGGAAQKELEKNPANHYIYTCVVLKK